MKKSILALALIGALSMLGACSSDNDGNGGKSVTGNFAKEPIKDAKLELFEVSTNGLANTPIATATTDAKGSFGFYNIPDAPDAKSVYVVKIADNGLEKAVLMNKGTGTAWNEVPDAIKSKLPASAQIIVAANPDGVVKAQFNPIGLAATAKAMADLGLVDLQDISADKIKVIGDKVNDNVATIATSLSVMSQISGTLVNPDTILKGEWSANLEYVLQLATLAEISFDGLAAGTVDLKAKKAKIDEVKAKAKENANDAAGAAGASEVKADTPKTDIIKSYLFSKEQPNVLIPNVINATNGSTHYLNGTIRGADLATEVLIVNGTKVQEVTTFVNATGITIATINDGIAFEKGTKNNFKLTISNKAPISNNTVILRSEFGNKGKNDATIQINIGDKVTNSSVLTSDLAPCGWGTDGIAFGVDIADDGSHVCTDQVEAPCGYYSDNTPRDVEEGSVYCIAGPAANPNPNPAP